MIKKPVLFFAYANDKTEDGVFLRNLSKEMHGIRRELDEVRKSGLCEVVERSSATIADIVDVLQDPVYASRIAVFHYAGHAGKEGLMLETLDGNHSLAHKEGLVDILARLKALKLVFLNGCSSEEQTKALLAAGVSAVVGTTSSINDEIATTLSIRFYKGLGLGNEIEKNWNDCISELKIETGNDITRAVKWAGKSEKVSSFPWEIHFNPNAEAVKKWNLPDAAGNPLFGLPQPSYIDPPESPFPGMNNYERVHTEVFFGRGKYIRTLYSLVTDEQAPFLILLTGQSRVGKTSLLKAGLIPRLETGNKVVYLKRMQEASLNLTVLNALLDLCGFDGVRLNSALSATVDEHNILASLEHLANQAGPEIRSDLMTLIEQVKQRRITKPASSDTLGPLPATLSELWLLAEKQLNKPVVIVIDQLEESFAQPGTAHQHEVVHLLEEVKQMLATSGQRPKGKMLLSFRSEFQSLMEARCKSVEISRSRVLLNDFEEDEVKEIFYGLTETPHLSARYNITIEGSVPSLVVADFSRISSRSSIGPAFQILASQMWAKAEEKNPGEPLFSKVLYQELVEDGQAVRNFLFDQLEAIGNKLPEAFESGMVLDLLAFHITKNTTAGIKTEEEIFETYPHSHELIAQTLKVCIEFNLLLDVSVNQKATQLAHDVFAGILYYGQLSSMRPVQQSNRILHSGLHSIQLGSTGTLFDDYELALIEKALPFMRKLTEEETQLLDKSKKESERRLHRAQKMKMVRNVVIAASIVVSLVISFLFIRLQFQEKQTSMSRMAAESTLANRRDNTHALYMAMEGMEIGGGENHENRLKEALITAFYYGLSSNAPRYKIVVKSANAILDILHNNAMEMLIPIPQDSIALIYNYDGDIIGSLKAKRNAKGSTSFSLLQKAAFGFDKKSIIGLGSDSTIRIWDLKGNLMYENSPEEDIRAFACSPLRNELALANADVIKLVSFGGASKLLKKVTKPVTAISYSPDGKKLLILYTSGPSELLDLESKQSGLFNNGLTIMNRALFSGDGKLILSCQNDSIMVLWDVKGHELNRFKPFSSKVTHFEFNPVEKVFSVCSGKNVNFFSTVNYDERVPMIDIRHNDFITRSVFSRSGIKLLTCSSDKTATSWDSIAPKNTMMSLVTYGEGTKLPIWDPLSMVKPLNGHKIDVTCGFYTNDENTVFTGSLDGTIRAWDLAIGKPFSFTGHNAAVTDIKLDPTRRLIFSIGLDSTILVKNIADEKNTPIAKLKYKEGLFNPDYSADYSHIVCVTNTNRVISWDHTSDRHPMELIKTPGKITRAIFFGDDSIVTVSTDGQLRFFSSAGDLYKTVKLSDSALTFVQYSYSSKKMAVATNNGVLFLVDPYGSMVDTLIGHKKNLSVSACNFSNNGKHLVSISEDNTAIVWDLVSNTHVILDKAIFTPYYKMKINSARFSEDGKKLVIAYSDRTARIWNTKGSLIATLMGHNDNVFDAGFSDNGRKIYTASDDTTVRWWDANGGYISWFGFGGKYKINQVEVSQDAGLIYAALSDGSIQIRVTAEGIYKAILQTPYYQYYKQHKERYSDADTEE